MAQPAATDTAFFSPLALFTLSEMFFLHFVCLFLNKGYANVDTSKSLSGHALFYFVSFEPNVSFWSR